MRHIYLTLQEHSVINELLEGDFEAIRPQFHMLLHDQALDWLLDEGAAEYRSSKEYARTKPSGSIPFVPHLGALRLKPKAQVEHRAMRHSYGHPVWPTGGLPSSPTGMRLLPHTEELASRHRLVDTYASDRNLDWSKRLHTEGATDYLVSQDQSTWHVAMSIEPRKRIDVRPLTAPAEDALRRVRIFVRPYIHLYPHGGLAVILGISLVFLKEAPVRDVVELLRLLLGRRGRSAFELAAPGLQPGSASEVIQQMMNATVTAIVPDLRTRERSRPSYSLSVSADREEVSDAELSGLLTLDDDYALYGTDWVEARASLYGKYAGDRIVATRGSLAVAVSPDQFPPSGRRRFFWRCHAIKEFATLQRALLWRIRGRLSHVGTSAGPDEATAARLITVGEHLIEFPRGLPAHHRKWFYECQQMIGGTTAIEGFYKVLAQLHQDAQHAAMMKHVEEQTGIHISLTNSQIGTLNLGTIVGDVEAHLAAIPAPQGNGARQALRQLTDAVLGSDDVDDQLRQELLERVDLLAEEAGKPPDQRRSAVVGAMLTGLATALAGAGGLAEVWTVTAPTLEAFFGG